MLEEESIVSLKLGDRYLEDLLNLFYQGYTEECLNLIKEVSKEITRMFVNGSLELIKENLL